MAMCKTCYSMVLKPGDSLAGCIMMSFSSNQFSGELRLIHFVAPARLIHRLTLAPRAQGSLLGCLSTGLAVGRESAADLATAQG